MLRVFETIRVKDGLIYNLEYHNQRVNRTRKELFKAKDSLDILDYLPSPPDKKEYRLKVVYSRDVESFEFTPYQKKIPKTFKIVEFEGDYSYKYLDRECIERVKRGYSDIDEFILIKNGQIGDTTIANIALLIDKKWFTPTKPILRGTTRQRYLDAGVLELRELSVDDIKRARAIALLNAMVDFLIIEEFEIV